MRYPVMLLLLAGALLAVRDLHDLPRVWAETEAVEARAESVARFHATLARTQHDLETGKLSLAKAADTVCACARRERTGYLCGLAVEFADSPERERVALSLLSHLRAESGASRAPYAALLLHDLCCELSCWPGVTPSTLATARTLDLVDAPRARSRSW